MSRAPDADGWVSLSDAQWTNIVNHEHAYEGMSKDDAVHLAVKMTEAKCRELNVDAKALTKLRDDFAAKALQGFCANPAVFAANGVTGWALVNCSDRQLVDYCGALADTMLVERAK